MKKILAGVTESDSHVVANHLLCRYLENKGFQVINLGACTSVQDFAQAFNQHPDTVALVIGSLNGHALEDLQPLKTQNLRDQINCPIILGGNLSVGAVKSERDLALLRELGIDHILPSYEMLPDLLYSIIQIRSPQRKVV